MPKKILTSPTDHILPLYINGLEGRMLKANSSNKKKREILLIYGHHATLERWWGLVENLRTYGNVTMPDMPGFGGMDSFDKINKTIDIDGYADYLASFIKLTYKRKKITIVGISFGFVVVTRMLQKYPDLEKKVELVVSLMGFTHKDDFVYSLRRRRTFLVLTRILGSKFISFFVSHLVLRKFIISYLYKNMPNSKQKFIEASDDEITNTLDYEIKAWRSNDIRTHWITCSQFFSLNNCESRINIPIKHVRAGSDSYFDPNIVKQHMQIAYKDFKEYIADSKNHTPSVLADKKAASVMLPRGLRRILAQERK